MIYSVHILRGICAWMVVIHHFCFSYFDGIENPLPHAIQQITFILGIGVDVFFVISGFVMSLLLQKHERQPIDAIDFARKRLLRIIPGWWFYLALFTIATTFIDGMPYHIVWDWQSFLESAFIIPHENLNGSGFYPILYVGWSLMYEIFFYCLIFIFLALPNKNITTSISLILLTISIIFPSSNILGHSNFFFIEFLIGFIFQKKPAFTGAVIIWSGISILKLYGLFEAARFALATSIFTIFISLKISKDQLVFKVLKRSGDYSYSIYLSHLLSIGLVHIILPPSNNIIKNSIALILTLISTHYISSLSFRWIENKHKKNQS